MSTEIYDINKRNEWLMSKHLVQGVDRCVQCRVEVGGEGHKWVYWNQCRYGKGHGGKHSFEEE